MPLISECGSPGRPAHGQTELRRDGFVVPSSQDYQQGDLVDYSCPDPQFSLLGASRRVCSREGVWRPELPSCGEWRDSDYHYQPAVSTEIFNNISPLWSTVVHCGHKTYVYKHSLTLYYTELLHGFTMCWLLLVALLQRDLLLPHHAEHHPVQGAASCRSSSLPPPSPGSRDHGLQCRAVLPEH